MPIRTLIIMLLVVAAVSGCGRRGSLEPPGAAAADEAAGQALPDNGVSPLDPGAPGTAAETAPAPPPDTRRPFFLDFLL